MSGNGEYGAARETVLAETRERAQTLASQGLLAREIAHRLDPGLTATERELLRGIASRAVAEARRAAVRQEGSGRPSLRPTESSGARPSWLEAAGKLWDQAKRRLSGRIDGGTGSLSRVVPVALAGVAVGVVLGLLLANGEHQRGTASLRIGTAGDHRPGAASGRKTGKVGKSGRRAAPSRTTSSPPRSPLIPFGGAPPPATPTSRAGASSAAELNDRGFQLMQAGRYQEAIPLLRRAVSTSPSERNDLTHAYALFNLGRSLRLAGRVKEAIPLLERRLKIDNQRATVARELQAARHSAASNGGAR